MRLHQEEMFPLPIGFNPDPKRRKPLLWVKELRIYRTFSPNPAHLLRRIELHPGLNILWAKPRERSRSGQRRTPGVSGHATGKTTFCRFLRYLLGESTFGNDDQRARLREAFPDGYIAGEVHLNGVPWTVCRPFRVGGSHHIAFRERKIETVFDDNDEGRTTFEEYRQELTRILVEPLPLATFATAPTPIEWPHLLQWLTRDQECRFAGLAELRHSSSDSHSPTMMVEDIHFLFRAVLCLIDPAEQQEIETNKDLLTRKQNAERDTPLLKFRGDSAYGRLRAQLSDFRTDLIGTEFLDAVDKEWTDRAKASESAIKQTTEPESLKQAREKLLDARETSRRAKDRRKEITQLLELTNQQLKQLRGDITAAEFHSWIKANYEPGRECGRTLAEAIEWECPLAVGRKLPVENKKSEIPAASLLQQLEQQQSTEAVRLIQANAEVQRCENLLLEASADLKVEIGSYDNLRGNLAGRQANDNALAGEARRAKADKAEANRLEESIRALEQSIRKSQDRQGAIREKRSAALSAFSQTFARVTRAILDEEVVGSINFSGRKIHPTLVHDIDLSSAALETLKIICFDLAALISGVEGRGNHPCFLIHDSPREADMDVDLYQQIFFLVREAENSFQNGEFTFQYIITTTEPPPVDLQCPPWLLDPILDATQENGRLLRVAF